MVAQSITLPVDEEGRVTIPDETRRELGIEPGDRVRITVKRRLLSVDELAGIVKTPPGLVADEDFGNIIREAMDDWADRKMVRFKESSE